MSTEQADGRAGVGESRVLQMLLPIRDNGCLITRQTADILVTLESTKGVTVLVKSLIRG